MQAERARLIWNPVAGRRPRQRKAEVARAAEILGQGGWQVDCRESDAVRGARAAAQAAVDEGFTYIIGCGGDGTLREIADVVARAGQEAPALGVLPMGTANVLAAALGCPREAGAAARWLLRARRTKMLLGEARRGDRVDTFLSVASVGLDAEVVRRIGVEAKRKWGKLAYAECALRTMAGYFPRPIEYSGGSADGIIFGLTGFYGGRMRLGAVHAGAPIVLALRGGRRLLCAQALALATVGLERGPGVTRLVAEELEVTTPGIAVQLDGDTAGVTPLKLGVSERWIEVLG
ncbi:MAG TPA: diacylglycerol kinase family protein [Terriglobales bacterium]|nr:diacylglycerol kinase family protein [Terriglobales bacterium]